MKEITFLIIVTLIQLCAMDTRLTAQEAAGVHIIGAMKHVMWDGQLEASIDLDTIAKKEHLYGIGPLEYLKGEITILDGLAFSSRVLTDSTMMVEESFDIEAPFLGYSNVADWNMYELPPHIRNIEQLEAYIDEMSTDAPRPFMFRVSGRVESAIIHIVNLPEGTTVTSPDEAHQGLTKYPLGARDVDIVGFFSTEHQAILTHHDTFVHLHLITSDRKKMGHLDEVSFSPGEVTLYLPK